VRIHDVSVLLHENLAVWPGDDPVELVSTAAIAVGDPVNMHRLALGTHTGTHLDAPRHFLDDGPTLQDISLDVLVGPARVIEWTAPGPVEAAAFEGLPPGAERVLIKTRNSLDHWWEHPFTDDYVYLSLDAARALVERGVRLVGADYLSVGEFGSGAETHHVLLGAGIPLLEGLDLSAVARGDYQLICLPLRLASPDGAPARAVLIEEV
jgi:arylformamidase